jgi:hypothetical protein
MAQPQKARNKTAPASTGSRKQKIAAYYEGRYPEKKLRRMFRTGHSIAALRIWADHYKTPSGSSGNGALIKIGKVLKLNLSQGSGT